MEGLEKYGRIGEAGRVTDRTVEEWQARRCMSRICKERFGVAGGERFAKEGVDGLGPVWQAWRGKEISGQSWYETVSSGKAGMARRSTEWLGRSRPAMEGQAWSLKGGN